MVGEKAATSACSMPASQAPVLSKHATAPAKAALPAPTCSRRRSSRCPAASALQLYDCAVTGALVPAWPAACNAASAAACTAAPGAPGDSAAQGKFASASVTTAALPRTVDGGARRPTPRPTPTATTSAAASAQNASTDGFRKKGAGVSA